MSSPSIGQEKRPLADEHAYHYQRSGYTSRFASDPNNPLRSPSYAASNRGYTSQTKSWVPTNPTKRRWLFIGLPVIIVLAAGVAVGVAIGVTHHKSSSGGKTGSGDAGSGSGGGSGSGSGTGGTGTGNNGTTIQTTVQGGTDGSTVKMDDGTTFTYSNQFGGDWWEDPSNPYSVSGKAQSWTPRVNETWTWGKDTIKGVNLGGWLVTEPFISPALYEPYVNGTPQAIDEYTLCQALGNNVSTYMENHYKTFITEQDFAEIAAAGLNWVRVGLGYWAVDTNSEEPFLPKVSWNYFLKAIEWSRKYGLRIYLDFHALPGSQNPWNHSGKSGQVNWMMGVMGIANAQRSLETIRSFVEYISQPGITEVVPMMDLVNEVQAVVVGHSVLASFYYEAYNLIRGITGYGTGKGPIIALHEGFEGIAAWQGFLTGADRIAIDQHPYLAFLPQQNNNPWSQQQSSACGWGGGTNDTRNAYGIVVGGEWSLAINSCGYWLAGVDSTPTYETQNVGSCDGWDQYWTWDADRKSGALGYAQANMDALQDWFFWTWKIGNSTVLGYPSSPMWHYRLGWQNGWIPQDPRSAGGFCSRLGVSGDQFNGQFPASATGGSPNPTIDASEQALNAFPPKTLAPSIGSGQMSLLPTLTQTGTPITLATPSHDASVTIGNGWANPSDTVGAYVTVAGCSYPDEYNAQSDAVPNAACTGGNARRAAARDFPRPTAAP